MQLLWKRIGKPDIESQLVQFVTVPVQVRHGLEHPTQLELIRKVVESIQLKHADVDEQVRHGERHGLH